MEARDYITIAISISALILSFISASIATRRQKTQLTTSLRDQLSSIVQELISTISENRVLQNEHITKRDALFYSKASSFSLKLSSLARQASALMTQDREIVFDVEFAVVAQALDIVGDYPEADRYWQAAMATSPSDYYKIVNKRGYADFLFRQGHHQAGRKQYEEALGILDNSSSDFNKYTNGYTYQMWYGSEMWNIPAPHGRANECYGDAKGLYESISSAAIKANCLQGLEATRLAYAGAPIPPTPSNVTDPAPSVVGEARAKS
jgi:tetratricopeptide (TPR) repeat protein